VLGRACGEPFVPDELYDEVRMAAPFAGLARADFDAVVDFVATGGYALKVYERFAKIRQGKDGRYRVANPRVAQHYRLNVGTIVEETMIKVRLMRSRQLGRSPTGTTAVGRSPTEMKAAGESPTGSTAGGHGPSGMIARGGRVLGELEEYFIEGLTPGDTFVFGGEVLRFEAMT
jgi:ATP-dependent helicase Lhr and Lhr-like helicase